jgi:hypothetical protein
VYNSTWASTEVLRALDDETAMRFDAGGLVLFSLTSICACQLLPSLVDAVRRHSVPARPSPARPGPA